MRAEETPRGSIVALPTPFREGRIDFAALRRLIDRQIDAGTDGLVVAGSTGEAATLDEAERLALFEFTVGVTRRRVPVLAGVGASDTRVVCQLAEGAERAGVDALLATTPAYVRPGQEGLRRHFVALADSTALPIVLYNIPSRTAVDLLPATIEELVADEPRFVAIKEASGSLERVRELVALGCLDVLCGEDPCISDCMQLGCTGAINVVGNLVPHRVAQLVHAFDESSEPAQAPELVESIGPLVRALAIETNPAPLKAALERMLLCEGELRLPLVPVSEESRRVLEGALAEAGLAL